MIGVEEKRSGSLVATAETSADFKEWRKYQQKILSTLSLLKKKACPHCHKGRKNHFYGKKEGQSYPSKSGGRVANSDTLARKSWVRASA